MKRGIIGNFGSGNYFKKRLLIGIVILKGISGNNLFDLLFIERLVNLEGGRRERESENF